MEEQTPVFLWGFDSHISELDIFDCFDRKRETSLTSVNLHRDPLGNSLRRATLMFTDKHEAHQMSVSLSGFPLDHGQMRMSLVSFPREEIPARVSNQLSNPVLQGPVPYQNTTYQLFPEPQAHVPWQGSQINPVLQGPVPYQNTTYQLYPGAAYMPQQGPTSQDFQINIEMRDVYVGNLSTTTTEGQLNMLFRAHGDLEHVSIIKTADGSSRGFGFVTFRHAESAAQAINSLNGYKFEGRVWEVQHRNSHRREEIREGLQREVICYVGNFRYELTEAGLKDMFAQFGEVSSCKIRRDPNTGKSKGDGFVEFVTPEAASNATVLNGKVIDGRFIYVSLARSKVAGRAGQGSMSGTL
ncbi:hypothetical protein CARUB_v10001285mg [Capsella rubella]|uniref:RRM domain-containing protein n=1 Tax=Capsella rubella TaxID=81985 RepID=R0FFE1_9BRAS|nr:polyadenylate-binding protein 2 isoform X1 [Capsella rubella]EOA20952.1 hypothetical protein CARUB_v10001285mg [Capsella rubella]